MPELPEVETVTRALRSQICGRKFSAYSQSGYRLRQKLPLTLDACLNSPIKSLERRAKYMLLRLENGHGFLSHLGMSGTWSVIPAESENLKHEHVIFDLDDGRQLRYRDPRRFGMFIPFENEAELQAMPLLTKLGPEPLTEEFNAKYLFNCSRKRKKPLKLFIMDNPIVVGVGNIYACESLFKSRLSPEMLAGKLTRKQCEVLVDSIKSILVEAIRAGGTTIADFTRPDGSAGWFEQKLQAYGREGKLCYICEGPMHRIIQGGRSTFYCPRCQK